MMTHTQKNTTRMNMKASITHEKTIYEDKIKYAAQAMKTSANMMQANAVKKVGYTSLPIYPDIKGKKN